MTFTEFKALSSWEKVRTITGIIPQTGDIEQDNSILIYRMAICCLIARVELGDAQQDFLDKTLMKLFPPEEPDEK